MEYEEAPSIQSVSREHQYSPIRWLSKSRFEEMIQSQQQRDLIRPYLDDTNRFNHSRVYIGRTSTSNETGHQGVRNSNQYFVQENHVPEYLEIIGSVVHNEMTGQWELHVCHASSEIVIEKDFWVLFIEDENAYEWKQTRLVFIDSLFSTF